MEEDTDVLLIMASDGLLLKMFLSMYTVSIILFCLQIYRKYDFHQCQMSRPFILKSYDKW